MLKIVAWHWGGFDVGYVAKLARGIGRNLKQRYEFICITDRPDEVHRIGIPTWEIEADDYPLLSLKRNFVRLRMFDPNWQAKHGIDDRLVCLDLDIVITGDLDQLFDRPEPFLILKGVRSIDASKYTGSVMMLRPGFHSEIWTDFDIDVSATFAGDDHWIWHKLPQASGWGPADGVYCHRKPGFPEGSPLPENARIVAMQSKRPPHEFVHLPWIKKHWV